MQYPFPTFPSWSYYPYFGYDPSYSTFPIPYYPIEQHLYDPNQIFSPRHNEPLKNSHCKYAPDDRKNSEKDRFEKKEELQRASRNKKSQRKNEDQHQNYHKVDRNIESNSIKLFMKALREESKRKGNLIDKIITAYQLPLTSGEFFDKLNDKIHPSLTYIKPSTLRKICMKGCEDEHDFRIVLRVALLNFFKKGIYMLSIKSIRTTKRIRLEQMKAGRRIIEFVSQND